MKISIIIALVGMLFSLQATEHLTFRDWKDQIKLNQKIFESEAHNAFVDIFVNKKAEQAYKNRASSYPVGAIVYKPLYSDAKKTELSIVVIMQKMAQGYDQANGDWWYGVYDASGTEGYHKGRIKSCIKCHAQVKETDYMFSNDVMDKIEKGKAIKNVLPIY
jgi:hypothetical protein